MHRSFVGKDWIDAFLNDKTIHLPKNVTERFFSILRIKPDELVAVFDGVGREVRGIVAQDKRLKKAVFIDAHLFVFSQYKPEIILLQAAIDEQKLSETVRRGCEYGVDRFVIFASINSDRFSLQKLMTKLERLKRIAEDACRQCGRYFIPSITFKADIFLALCEEKPKMSLGVFGDQQKKRCYHRFYKNNQRLM